MEPRIQYAKTEDGVSIAFYTLGEGMPMIAVRTAAVSHLQIEWQSPGMRRTYEALARRTRLVRYDPRGAGLSDRNVADRSIDAHVSDVETVADRLGLERFALLSILQGGPVSIAYAARHPEQVSHLILWCSSHTTTPGPRADTLFALAEQDWDLWLETVAHVGFGWSEGEEAHRRAAQLRETLTLDEMRAFGNPIRGFDATELLPQVNAPTLVLHRRGVPFPSVDIAKTLASRIPNARLVLLEGESLAPWVGDMDSVFGAIDDFLGEGDVAAAPELPEGMAVLLFADIAESTALTEQLGDSAFRAKARELDTSLRSVIRETGGTPVEGKVLGDGVLAVFTSARQAIDCALRCEAAGEPLGLQLHVGIHAGDVIREGNNVYGGAVNIAARIAAASAPGEVLVSDTVRSLGRTSADVTFDDRGEHTLKGVGEPQRLFAVRGGG
jgi:class 3 adenylate cyclase